MLGIVGRHFLDVVLLTLFRDMLGGCHTGYALYVTMISIPSHMSRTTSSPIVIIFTVLADGGEASSSSRPLVFRRCLLFVAAL